MKFKNYFLSVVALVAFGLTSVGCSDDDNDLSMKVVNPQQQLDIVETAAAAGNFKTLLAAAEAAGLVGALKGDGPLTVFAPTDDAFAALPEGTVEALLQDPETLAGILTYHVVAGKVTSSQVVNLTNAVTLNGASIDITVTNDGTVMVDNATVIATDIEASNGIIHVIDAVILPGAEEVGDNTSIDAINAAYKTSAVYASSRESDSDSKRANAGRMPIYALANKSGLKTLAAAIEAVGLQRTLNVDGPFTVFAPTEEAFAALPEGTLEALLQDPETLTNILLYHVVSGVVKAEDVVGLSEATMLNGQTVSITIDDGVMVNDANVVATDIMAKNGVVHLIDKVLIP